MAVHQVEITTEKLLDAVVQMPEREFKDFISNARKIRTKKQKSATEIELIQKINAVFKDFPRQKYNELNAKFEAQTLSKAEYEELLNLSDKSEILNAERLRYLAEIAKIKSQSLEQVMQDLGYNQYAL